MVLVKRLPRALFECRREQVPARLLRIPPVLAGGRGRTIDLRRSSSANWFGGIQNSRVCDERECGLQGRFLLTCSPGGSRLAPWGGYPAPDTRRPSHLPQEVPQGPLDHESFTSKLGGQQDAD